MAVLNPQTYLIAFGIVILVAFLGHVIFQRTKMPDVILLIFLGALLGPILPLVNPNWQPILNPDIFSQLLPLLGAVAIIVILFDGGLKLNIRDLFVGVAPATFLSVLGFLATVLIVGGLLSTFGVVGNIWVGLLLGAILGGTSSVVVMPIVEKMSIDRRTKTILGLESALTDVLVVVVTISLSITLAVQAAALDPQGFTQGIVQQFAVGVAFGLGGGFLWVHYLRLFTQRSFEYMLTIALLFLFYAVTEFLDGSGAIAVLAFGLVVGNSRKRDPLTGHDLAKAKAAHARRHRWVPVFTIDLVNLHNEIVFFVRAFFFVALGVILDLEIFFNARFVGISLVLLLGIVAARLWAVIIVFFRSDVPERDKNAVAFLMPRGLAAAALAAVPFTTYGIFDERATVSDFVAYAVMILILTNLVTSVGVYLFENEAFQRRLREWQEVRAERQALRREERARQRAQRASEREAARTQETTLKLEDRRGRGPDRPR